MRDEHFIGVVYLLLGVVYTFPAVVCVFVLIRPPLVHHSSFKMMCFISLMDICNLVACCFFAGFYSLTDANYRNTPSMLLVGRISLVVWVAYCASNVLLALDRLVCFSSMRWSQQLFAGKRTFFWILLAVLAGAQMMIEFDGQQRYHYDSSIGGWRFELLPEGTKNYRHMSINIATFATLVLLYSLIVIVIFKKSTQDKLQTQAAVQSAAICGFAMGADIFCIIVQNIHNPSVAMCYTANFAWQLAHGGTGYACLILNRTIREATFHHFCRFLNLCGVKRANVTKVLVISNTQHV